MLAGEPGSQAVSGKRGRSAGGGGAGQTEEAPLLPVERRPPVMSGEALGRLLRLIVDGGLPREGRRGGAFATGGSEEEVVESAEEEEEEAGDGESAFAALSREPRFQAAVLRMCSARLAATAAAAASQGALLAGCGGDAAAAVGGLGEGGQWEAMAPPLVQAVYLTVMARAGISGAHSTGTCERTPLSTQRGRCHAG